MGLIPASSAQYESAIKKLFPEGAYWDKQFADNSSDVSLFVKAKLDTLVRFRTRLDNLLDESMIQTAKETLDDWERVLIGTVSFGFTTAQRRSFLSAATSGNLNIETIQEIGRTYGVTITNIVIPFRPAFFGHSRFGIERIASPVAFSVLFIYATRPDDAILDDFENQLTARILSNYIVYFIYGGS